MTRQNHCWIVGFSVVAAIAAAGLAFGQKAPPLYLDTRPREDVLLIEVNELVRQYSRPAVEHYGKALDNERKGRRADAVAHLEEAIRLAPEFFFAHNSLGILYQDMMRYRMAEQEFNEAHRLNPRSAAPLVNLASVHIEEAFLGVMDSLTRQRMLNKALACLNTALEIEPSSLYSHLLIGIVYYLTGLYEDAESHFLSALDSGAGLGEARLGLAEVYLRVEKWESAIVQLNAYLKENPFTAKRPRIEDARDKAVRKLGDHHR